MVRFQFSKNMDRQKPTKLNDSVYEFYRAENYELEVVAFHGLCFSTYENAYITTWQDKERRCWLRDFIAEKCPESRVLSVSYDSCAKVSDEAGRMSFSNLGRILVQDLIHLAGVGQRGCPVVLIGYCLGGLVIEQLCTEAEKQYDQAPDGSSKGRLDEFLTNVRSVLYLDTPHTGSPLGDYLRVKHQCEGPVLEYLNTSSSSLSSLSREFDSLVFEREWDRFICWYYHATEVWDSVALSAPGLEVVTESSARRDAKHFRIIESDHSGKAVSSAWSHLVGVWGNLQERMETIRKMTELSAYVRYKAQISPEKQKVSQEEPNEKQSSPNKSSETAKRRASRKQPKEIRESDVLYVMHEPDNDGVSSKVELELIFFPGTVDDRAYKSTWMSKDGEDCWLQTWLPEAFPSARILAVSLLAQDRKEFDLDLICKNLIDAITSYHKRVGWCPLILVGHCKGGLVIKKLCNKVDEEVARNATNADQLQVARNPTNADELPAFLRSVRGFAYYGTSHAGYGSEDSSKDISSRAVGRLNSTFERFISSYGCKELALGETRPTHLVMRTSCRFLVLKRVWVDKRIRRACIVNEENEDIDIRITSLGGSSKSVTVDEVSASHGIQRNSFFPMAADHISICKPESPLSNSFLYLKHFIRTTVQEVQYRNMNVRRKKLRGMAIIISMEKNRVGSDIDRRRFLDMADYIKFSPAAIVDQTANNLRGRLQAVLEKVTEEDECLLCCVCAHGYMSGGRQFIYDNKQQSIELLSVVLEPVINYPKLVGKPKVLVINACRVYEGDPVDPEPDQNMAEADDCLFMYSCVPGESAWRPIGYENGTLFVGEVADQMKWRYQTTDVQDIFTEVKRRLPELATELGREHEPVIHSTLSKRLSWRPR